MVADVPASPASRTILVVDDEALVRELVAQTLSDGGHHVLEAASGAEAIEVLRTQPSVDLLITDVGLPGGLNGRQVAEVARQERPGLRVLFITGYAENAVLSHGHLDPGMQVLTKPFELGVLLQRAEFLMGPAGGDAT
jgi:CheY-like chemotaxis protein